MRRRLYSFGLGSIINVYSERHEKIFSPKRLSPPPLPPRRRRRRSVHETRLFIKSFVSSRACYDFFPFSCHTIILSPASSISSYSSSSSPFFFLFFLYILRVDLSSSPNFSSSSPSSSSSSSSLSSPPPPSIVLYFFIFLVESRVSALVSSPQPFIFTPCYSSFPVFPPCSFPALYIDIFIFTPG